ncbi:MAG: hypothetical protein LR008_03235 [Candidatus Pacebacteria bacterium]|nr:hypothetical protein [Candidatus Paceibacterota bacterium]
MENKRNVSEEQDLIELIRYAESKIKPYYVIILSFSSEDKILVIQPTIEGFGSNKKIVLTFAEKLYEEIKILDLLDTVRIDFIDEVNYRANAKPNDREYKLRVSIIE